MQSEEFKKGIEELMFIGQAFGEPLETELEYLSESAIMLIKNINPAPGEIKRISSRMLRDYSQRFDLGFALALPTDESHLSKGYKRCILLRDKEDKETAALFDEDGKRQYPDMQEVHELLRIAAHPQLSIEAIYA